MESVRGRPDDSGGGSFKDAAGGPFTAADIRFTTRGDTLYAIALGWPQDGRITIRSLSNGKIKTVELVGSNARLKWHSVRRMYIELLAEKPCDYAFTLKIAPVR